MKLLILQGKESFTVRRLAIALTANVDDKDFLGEVVALFTFVQKEIRYINDANGIEQLHGVEQLLEQRAGDCDDKVILLASLLESIGHPTKLYAVGFVPGSLTHVFLLVCVGGVWVPLDPTEDAPPGWAPPGIRQSMELDNVEV